MALYTMGTRETGHGGGGVGGGGSRGQTLGNLAP